MKNSYIMKLGGLITLVCYLLLPATGKDASHMLNGIDLLSMKDTGIPFKFITGFALLCAITIIFLPNRVVVFFTAIVGFISLLIAFFLISNKLFIFSSPGEISTTYTIINGIGFKHLIHLSIFGFVISAIFSRLKEELFFQKP